MIDIQRVKSFSTMQVQYAYAAVQLLCYLLTCTESRRYNVFKTVDKQVQNCEESSCDSHWSVGNWSARNSRLHLISEQPSHVAFDRYYSGLCLNWWLKDERLCSWSLELSSPPNLLSSVCVRLQNKWPFSSSIITIVKWESGAFSCYCPQCKVQWQQTESFLHCCQSFPV